MLVHQVLLVRRRRRNQFLSSFKNTNTSKGCHKLKQLTLMLKGKGVLFLQRNYHLRKNCISFKYWFAKKGKVLNVFVCAKPNLVFILPQS